MSVLTVVGYSDCDARGVPLDWDCCRRCAGKRYDVPSGGKDLPCIACGGHGSLRVAVLAFLGRPMTEEEIEAGKSERGGFTRAQLAAWGVPWPAEKGWRKRLMEGRPADRCEGCGHPMSGKGGLWDGGEWEDPRGMISESLGWVETRWRAVDAIGRGVEPALSALMSLYWSPCDRECAHGAPVRYRVEDAEWTVEEAIPVPAGCMAAVVAGGDVQAGWRPVDVRPMNGWAHDLRRENLRLLCARCYVEKREGPSC